MEDLLGKAHRCEASFNAQLDKVRKELCIKDTTRCDKCGFRVRSPLHEEGMHHKTMKRSK